jgi:hypothetical protein
MKGRSISETILYFFMNMRIRYGLNDQLVFLVIMC